MQLERRIGEQDLKVPAAGPAPLAAAAGAASQAPDGAGAAEPAAKEAETAAPETDAAGQTASQAEGSEAGSQPAAEPEAAEADGGNGAAEEPEAGAQDEGADAAAEPAPTGASEDAPDDAAAEGSTAEAEAAPEASGSTAGASDDAASQGSTAASEEPEAAPPSEAPAKAEAPDLGAGTYGIGPLFATFSPDGSFTMRNVELDTSASGKWEVTDGLLTLSDPEGGSGSSSFPMLCQLVKGGGGAEACQGADRQLPARRHGDRPPLRRKPLTLAGLRRARVAVVSRSTPYSLRSDAIRCREASRSTMP